MEKENITNYKSFNAHDIEFTKRLSLNRYDSVQI